MKILVVHGAGMSGHEQRHANNSELHGCMHPETLAIAPKVRTAEFELSINMKTVQVLGLETCLEICLGNSNNRLTRSSRLFTAPHESGCGPKRTCRSN